MIRVYTGRLGSGKTSSMVEDVRREFSQSLRQVYTNAKSLHFPEQIYLDIDDPAQLANITQGIIVYDEAQVALSSRFFQKTPRETLSALAQLRKNGLDLYCTTQNFDRLDTVLRELVSEEVNCRRVGPFTVQVVRDPVAKVRLRVRLKRVPSVAYALYDSWEVLGSALKERVRDSAVLGRLRRTRDAKRRGRSKQIDGRIFVPRRLWWSEGNRVMMLPEATRALRWLELRGDLAAGRDHWQEMVRDEVARRRWLSHFGLGPDDVPTSCNFAHPWAAGGCPCHRAEDEPERRYEAMAKDPDTLNMADFTDWLRQVRRERREA